MTQPSFAILGSKAVCLQLIRATLDAQLMPSRVMTLDDRNDTRSRFAELREVCRAASVPFGIATTSVSTYHELLAESPSVVLVAGWYRIIPEDVLERSGRGFYGIHYSRLPRFRGSAPVVWAMLAGELTVGYSLFRLSAGMDEGGTVVSGEVPANERYVGDVLNDLDQESARAIARILPELMDGTAELRSQGDRRSSYCGVRTPADGHLDWSQPASVLARAVRAQSRPYPGAFARVPGGRVRIWRAEVETGADYLGMPGQCVRMISADPVIVAGGHTGLRLTEFDLEPDDGQVALDKLRLNSRLH